MISYYILPLVVLGGELAVPFSRKPLYAGLNPPSRIIFRKPDPADRSLRNRHSWTSSGPEGSSDKWWRLCRGSIPVMLRVRSTETIRQGVHNRFSLSSTILPTMILMI